MNNNPHMTIAHVLRRPKTTRTYGDGTELDVFDDLVVDRSKESFMPSSRSGSGSMASHASSSYISGLPNSANTNASGGLGLGRPSYHDCEYTMRSFRAQACNETDTRSTRYETISRIIEDETFHIFFIAYLYLDRRKAQETARIYRDEFFHRKLAGYPCAERKEKGRTHPTPGQVGKEARLVSRSFHQSEYSA
jgi:hypothetical protein